MCEVCYGLPAQRKHRVAVLRATEKMLPGLPDWRCRRSTYKRGNMLVFYNAASVPSTARADAKRVHSWWGHKWDEPARLAEAERAVAEHAIMQHAGDEERQQLTERRRAEWQLEGAKLSYAVAVARNPVGVLVGASRMASDTLSELEACSMSDRLANAIEDAGIDRAKAERLASTIVDLIHDNVATKGDVAVVRADVQNVETRLNASIDLVRHRLMTRLGGLAVVLSGLIVAAIHLWPPH